MRKYTPLTLLMFFGLVFNLPALCQETTNNWYTGEVFSIQSNNLKEERHYRLGLPASYPNSQRKYPVIYVLDGESYYYAAAGAVRALSSLSLMPEAIVVAIHNPDRQSDMSPPDMDIPSVRNKKGDQFLQFLEKELVPHIEKQYRTLPLSVLLGHSHGGIFSLYALQKSPELFRFHIALDAPVHLDAGYLEKGLKDLFKKQPDHAGRLIVGWNRYGWSADMKQFLSADKGSNFSITEIDASGETHQSMYYPGFYHGLKSLFSDHEYKHTKTLTFKELKARYAAMNAAYGYEIPIPIWALRYGALDHLVAADANAARPFIEALESIYESSDILDDNGREWLEELERNPPKESRAQFMSRPGATAQQVRDFEGTWRGGSYTIEIDIEKGEPKAIITQRFPGGEQQVTSASKITLMDNGALDLVYENRMPPRTGLIYFQLSPVYQNTSQLKQGFRVYWPRMEGRNQARLLQMRRD